MTSGIIIRFRINLYIYDSSIKHFYQILSLVRIMACNLLAVITTMIYLLIYLFLVLAVAFMSLTKRIGFSESLFISLFLTPLIGFVIVFKAKDNIQKHNYTMERTCTSCGNQSVHREKTCPHCGDEMEVLFNVNKLNLA